MKPKQLRASFKHLSSLDNHDKIYLVGISFTKKSQLLLLVLFSFNQTVYANPWLLLCQILTFGIGNSTICFVFSELICFLIILFSQPIIYFGFLVLSILSCPYHIAPLDLGTFNSNNWMAKRPLTWSTNKHILNCLCILEHVPSMTSIPHDKEHTLCYNLVADFYGQQNIP
jgi:hypothetical protein